MRVDENGQGGRCGWGLFALGLSFNELNLERDLKHVTNSSHFIPHMIYGNDDDDDDDDSEKNRMATMIHEFMQNVRNFFLY